MLTRVSVTNFRCLQNVTVRLEPPTILVGPNASGKTTLLRALDPGRLLDEQDFWQGRQGSLKREFSFDDRPRVVDAWSLVSTPPRLNRSQQPDWPGFRYQLLQLQPVKLRNPNLLQEQTLLADDGGNLANVFVTLARDRQNQLVKDFTRLVPVYRDVVSRPSQGGHHRLVFQDRWSDVWDEPAQVSDGSIGPDQIDGLQGLLEEQRTSAQLIGNRHMGKQ
ncbi:MAG: AAA family ATPase [Polyangiaceae bacterium]|nr:AAA family ATPase [Polyangiaceae bacterium]